MGPNFSTPERGKNRGPIPPREVVTDLVKRGTHKSPILATFGPKIDIFDTFYKMAVSLEKCPVEKCQNLTKCTKKCIFALFEKKGQKNAKFLWFFATKKRCCSGGIFLVEKNTLFGPKIDKK